MTSICLCIGDHDDSRPTSVSASMTTSGGASTTNSRDAFTATENNLATARGPRTLFTEIQKLPADFAEGRSCRRRRFDRPGRRAGETRCGRRLLDAVGGDHRRARLQMVAHGGFPPGQYRGDTRIGAGENLRPLVAGSAGEPFGEG